MADHCALGGRDTRVLDAAGTDAVVVVAGLVGGTVEV